MAAKHMNFVSLRLFICLLGVCYVTSGAALPETFLKGDEICKSATITDWKLSPKQYGTTFDDANNEAAAKIWLERYNELSQVVICESGVASWNHMTNLTDNNAAIVIEYAAKNAAFDKEAYEAGNNFNWRNFSAPTRRLFSKVTDIGTSSLDDAKFERLSKVMGELEVIYSTAKVCNKPGDTSGKCYPLDPDLSRIMATSRDYDELLWAWKGWREQSGNKMPAKFTEMINLQNDAADVNGYEDGGDFWRSSYETPGFRKMCDDLWAETKPLYDQIHAYTRRKLRQAYPNNTFPESGHIPAHLLGNMWAQQWNLIEPLVRPYPNTPSVDVTDEMIKQGYDTEKIFKLSEEFFTSIGMDPMVDTFWTESMVEKPEDREVVCHASAWDFYNQENFRIKQCTEIDMHWLTVTHHEMGHVVYFQQYKHQPTQYRNGANSGFHEAIGDIMELSVSTPEHLNKIGLLPNFNDTAELDLNFLMTMALKKISFLPFGFGIDKWRWNVFDNSTPVAKYNEDWWNIRCSLQGLSPPVARSSSDFDAGSKYHVANNVPYIRYFMSHMLQFQIQQSLCAAANNTRPLHRCSIYQSKEAGDIMKKLMEPGSSKTWPDVLESALGSRELSAKPLLAYFKPLMDYLKTENEKNGERIGWDDECDHGM